MRADSHGRRVEALVAGEDTEALKDFVAGDMLVRVDFLEHPDRLTRVLLLRVELKSEQVDSQLVLIALRDVVAGLLDQSRHFLQQVL